MDTGENIFGTGGTGFPKYFFPPSIYFLITRVIFKRKIFFNLCKYITKIQFVPVIINHKLAELTSKSLLGTLEENKFPYLVMRIIISIIIPHKCYFFYRQKITFIITSGDTSGRQAVF